jgi:hypothetical protein
MRRFLISFLLIVNFLVFSCIIFGEVKIHVEQTKIVSINQKNDCIGILLNSKIFMIHINEDTKIISGKKEIKFPDLDVNDKVEVSYIRVAGFMEFGGNYVAKTIKLLN